MEIVKRNEAARLIQGVILKCVDGRWTDADGLTPSLLNIDTADTYTYLNYTTGARIAVERLADRFKWMKTIRGSNVVPIVKLSAGFSCGRGTALSIVQQHSSIQILIAPAGPVNK
jgi:hypothetical protein